MNLITLDLKFPIIRDQQRRGDIGLTYSNDPNNGKNCANIERAPGGGWLIVVDNQYSYWVADDQVQGQEARPNRTSDDLAVPTGISKHGEQWRCDQCGKVCPTLHGAKTHRGSHARE